MRYSLLSRFYGGLLGNIIGELLSSNCQGKEREISPWSEIVIQTTDTLIKTGNLVQNDWQRIKQNQKNFPLNRSANSSEAALATLPIALFFHENFNLLQEGLRQARIIWQDQTEVLEDVLLWGYAIALALREKLEAKNIITQIITYPKISQTPLLNKLEQVRSFLERGIGLEQFVTQMSSQCSPSQMPIVLALYCFGYSPEDFYLCVTRAIRGGYQPQITAALTGALAGVYNSYSGIPLNWRIALRKNPLTSSMKQKAKYLFNVWSGVYQPDNIELPNSVAIASPMVIQPRPSLKIISQKE